MKYLILLLILFILSAGCITLGKNIYRDNFAPTPIPTIIETIETTPEPVLTTVQPTPIPIPTTDPISAFKLSGGLNISEWFNFTRKTYRDQISVKTTVYRYQVRDKYHIITSDQDIQNIKLPKPGYFFLFIWVRTVSNSTTPLGGYGPSCFDLDPKGQRTMRYFEPMPISELFYKDMAGYGRAWPYGYTWGRNQETKKMEFIELAGLDPGNSNAWDGYIIYQIPKTIPLNAFSIRGDFDGMFHAKWQFAGGDKFSFNSPPEEVIANA